jgi:hypothetical protein
MTPATSALNIEPALQPKPAAQTPAAPAAPATLIAADGQAITAALIEISADGPVWTATLTRLDRPGLVASLVYGRGVRDVTLQLNDGRSALARITGTAFVAGGQRICQITGLEPLS